MNALVTPSLEKRDALGVSFYTDEKLFAQCGVRIAFSCRSGGVSAGDDKALSSLNVGTNVDDAPENVASNRAALLRALDAPLAARLAFVNQVHGKEVASVDGEILLRPAWDEEGGCMVSAIAEADAIVVKDQSPPTIAMLSFADCMPVVFVAPSGAFAVVHAGWRGVANRIAISALEALCADTTPTSPKDINAYIGPCIHKECFEVSEDLCNMFASEFGEQCIFKERNVDLVNAMTSTLLVAGVKKERIAYTNKCTVCNTEEFFSYRASGGKCGRHAALAFRVLQGDINDNCRQL